MICYLKCIAIKKIESLKFFNMICNDHHYETCVPNTCSLVQLLNLFKKINCNSPGIEFSIMSFSFDIYLTPISFNFSALC